MAKANLHTGPTLGDSLDSSTRRLQENQSVGLPVGPDCSFVLAEIVASAVDEVFVRSLGHRPPGFRALDDYELSFATLSQAEEALAILHSSLTTFELDLNPEKTRIEEAPLPIQSPWVTALRSAHAQATSPRRRGLSPIINFCSLALELAGQYPRDSVLPYALRQMTTMVVPRSGWRVFESLVYNAAASDPGGLPQALDVLAGEAQQSGRGVDTLRLSELLESLVARHAPLGNGNTVAWCIWAALVHRVSQSASAAALISTMEDNVVALLAIDARRRELVDSPLDTGGWRRAVADPEALEGENWLLAYKGACKGWTCPALAGDDFFLALKQAGVRFYSRDLATLANQRSRPVPGAMTWLRYPSF